jgi:hypothetical protein
VAPPGKQVLMKWAVPTVFSVSSTDPYFTAKDNWLVLADMLGTF